MQMVTKYDDRAQDFLEGRWIAIRVLASAITNVNSFDHIVNNIHRHHTTVQHSDKEMS